MKTKEQLLEEMQIDIDSDNDTAHTIHQQAKEILEQCQGDYDLARKGVLFVGYITEETYKRLTLAQKSMEALG